MIRTRRFICATRFFSIFYGILSLAFLGVAQAADPIKIRLGYQSLWAGGGEIFETLRHTNILELNGIAADFKVFTFGGPLGEAAVAGEIDNIYAADTPVLRAAARLPGSKIFFRTHDYRFGVLVRTDFKGTSLKDLKGSTLAASFGTTAFPHSIRAIVASGIKDPFSEMTIINQDASEQANAMRSGLVDAVVSWDPTMQRLIDQNSAKILWEVRKGDSLGVMALTESWLKAHSEEDVVRLIKAWIMATWWTSNNIDLAHKWFAETSRLSPEILRSASNYDRNLVDPVVDINKIDLSIAEEDIESTQHVIDFLYGRRMLTNRLNVKPYFDLEPLKKAKEEISAGKFPDLSAIRVLKR